MLVIELPEWHGAQHGDTTGLPIVAIGNHTKPCTVYCVLCTILCNGAKGLFILLAAVSLAAFIGCKVNTKQAAVSAFIGPARPVCTFLTECHTAAWS